MSLSYPPLRAWFLLLVFTAGACSDATDDSKIPAVDLETGEIGNFSPSDLPAGWAICGADGCEGVGDSIPCASRGAALCEVDARCGLQLLSCETPAAQERAIECGYLREGAASRPPDSPDYCGAGPLDDCAYACVPTEVLACEEIADPRVCANNVECSWTENPPRCQPAAACPEIGPTDRVDCPENSAVPLFDESGCLLGFRCLDDCPELAVPKCAHGETPNRLRDERSGCVIGFECAGAIDEPTVGLSSPAGDYYDKLDALDGVRETEAQAKRCAELSSDYEQTLRKAKVCSRYDPASAGDSAGCTVTVPNTLGCGCPTYVNATNKGALERLNELRREWQRQGCELSIVCARVACYAPKGARCLQREGDQFGAPDRYGTCEDL